MRAQIASPEQDAGFINTTNEGRNKSIEGSNNDQNTTPRVSPGIVDISTEEEKTL